MGIGGARDRSWDTAVALELSDKRREALRPWQLLVAQRRDCTACVLDAATGKAVRALERLDQLGIGVGRRAQSRSLELERESRERMREHVVHLAREPLALAEHGRLCLRFACLLELAHKALSPLLIVGESCGEPRDDVERDDTERLQ